MIKQHANFIDVGNRLELARQLRERQHGDGFDKQDVATAAGMSPSAYTQWINGTTRSYDAEKMLRVAAFLRVRPEWLMFGAGPMEDSSLERAAAQLLRDPPPEVVNETLNFMAFQLNKSIADDRERLGNYLKMIDEIINSRKD